MRRQLDKELGLLVVRPLLLIVVLVEFRHLPREPSLLHRLVLVLGQDVTVEPAAMRTRDQVALANDNLNGSYIFRETI